jgi:alkylresorcinol/alkylpyrone synthase
LPKLLGIEAAPSRFHHSQDDVIRGVLAWLAGIGAESQSRAVERLFERSGVGARSSFLPLAEVFADRTFAERNETYQKAMIETGIAVASRALERFELRNVDAIVSSSCTGFMIPAVDAHIINRLALGPWIARLPITEAGCAGGAVALSRTADFLSAHPKDSALAIAIEFSSLTFQARDPSATNLVATALFADGSAVAGMVGDQHPSAGRAIADFAGSASSFLPESLGAMGYDVVESGLKLVLDKRLPDFLRGRLKALVDEFLAANGTSLGSIDAFAIHPGGRKVLDVAEEELGLSESAMRASRAVLREHGNMSSATILFVLDRALAPLDLGARVLGIGFGPGFGVELSLWTKASPPYTIDALTAA